MAKVPLQVLIIVEVSGCQTGGGGQGPWGGESPLDDFLIKTRPTVTIQ